MLKSKRLMEGVDVAVARMCRDFKFAVGKNEAVYFTKCFCGCINIVMSMLIKKFSLVCDAYKSYQLYFSVCRVSKCCNTSFFLLLARASGCALSKLTQ